jgi:alpha-tubulin suppressor-like RCC1 family protein
MASRLTPFRRPLAAVAAMCVAGACVGAANPSSSIMSHSSRPPSGWTVEYWGAVGSAGHEYDRNLTPASLPVPAPVVQVASSNSTEYALLNNGEVWAWGLGSAGQFGNGTTGNSFDRAVQVQFPAGVKIAFLPTDVMPYDAGLAVDTAGHAWAWGMDKGGEFCLGNKRTYLNPVELPFSDVSTLAGAAQHAIFDSGGTVYSCGDNEYGELGDGTFTSSTTAVRVTGLADGDVSDLVAAWGDTGAQLSNGEYYDWGFDDAGQLGNGTLNQASPVPVQVKLPGPVTRVAAGGSLDSNGQSIAILVGGAVYAWGNDHSDQLGDSPRLAHVDTGEQAYPVRIYPPSGVTYEFLATGGDTSYAISTTGDVYAWGGNADGQVGDGTTVTASQPVRVASGAGLISATATDVVVGAQTGIGRT